MAEYCSDEFKMIEDNEDSFRMWQGLVGPHYTPYISADGTLSFGNNGGLPNPSPVNLRGPQGAGIRIAGIVSTESAMPVTAATGDIWLVGDETPYEGFSFIDGQWIDLGPLAVGPAGPPGPQGDDYILQESDKQEIAEIAEQVLLTELDETPLAIRYGGTGSRTVEGAKQALGIDEIETKLGTWPLGTDAQDVAGAVNEMIGEIALQVDDIQKLKDDLAAEFSPDLTYAVGSYCVYSGILYRCISAVTTPGSWTGSANWIEVKAADEIKALREDVEDLDAGDIDFNSSATYAAGTVGKELVEQKNTLNSKADEESLALRRSGATNTGAQIENGTYFYLDGTLKHAIATIAQNASFTAQNCETVTAGGLNAVNSQIGNVVDTTTSLLGLHEGVNAFVLNSGIVIGGVSINNKLRGYAVYNQGVVVGFGVNYNAAEFYTLGASGSNVWQYAKAW